jgi:hypothetical protein
MTSYLHVTVNRPSRIVWSNWIPNILVRAPSSDTTRTSNRPSTELLWHGNRYIRKWEPVNLSSNEMDVGGKGKLLKVCWPWISERVQWLWDRVVGILKTPKLRQMIGRVINVKLTRQNKSQLLQKGNKSNKLHLWLIFRYLFPIAHL